MGRRMKHYSVYDRHTDQPILIHATRLECMGITGISLSTFYSYVTHTRTGKHKRRYEIYPDEEDDEEDGQE